MKFFKRLSVERRKVRWSSFNKTIRVFFSTIILILIFMVIIVLFSYVVENILDLL